MVYIPFFLIQVGMEPSRSLAEQSTPISPATRGTAGLGASGGAGHGSSCSAPSPWMEGIQATLAHTQQDAG